MRLIIIGAGGYGKTVADIARQSGKYDQVDFLDDNESLDYTIGKCSDYAKFANVDTEIYPAFGNNESRLKWINKLISEGINVPTIVHETAYVSPTAKIGKGTIVLPRAVINTGCVVENGCIINCGAIVDHACIIGQGSHICLGAIVKGENRIAECTKIEAGEVVQMRAFPIGG